MDGLDRSNHLKEKQTENRKHLFLYLTRTPRTTVIHGRNADLRILFVARWIEAVE